jgi:hypothetical protein
MVDISAIGTAERCRVLLRLKPSPYEESSPIQVEGTRVVVRRDGKDIRDSYTDENNSTFSFDQVFGPEVGQEQLFQSVLQDSIEPVISGEFLSRDSNLQNTKWNFNKT